MPRRANPAYQRGSTALKVVPEQQPATHLHGDVSKTQEAMREWTAGQRKCRARKRHNWIAFTVWEYPTIYDVVERCSHCGNRRHADHNKRGRRLEKWKPDYRNGYLLPKGAAPIDEDMHDELVLEDILSRKIVKAADAE